MKKTLCVLLSLLLLLGMTSLAQADEAMTLRLWVRYDDDFSACIADFEALHPGVKIIQEQVGNNYDDLLAKYTHKKELFLKGLDDLHIVHNDPEGAYYVLMDISRFGYDSDLKFCEDLARLVGVGAVPGSSFFREPVNHLIRFHFAKKDETLLAALNRLESLKDKIPARG